MILSALSLTQPWCELVLGEADKDIENRVWNCHKRGTFLIHASAGMTFRQYATACDFAANTLRRAINISIGAAYTPADGVLENKEYLYVPGPREVVRGGLVGAAEILDVIPPGRVQPDGSRHPKAGSRWLMHGCYGFVLGKRVRLPFRAMNGRQRWFPVEVTVDEEATLRAAGMVLP